MNYVIFSLLLIIFQSLCLFLGFIILDKINIKYYIKNNLKKLYNLCFFTANIQMLPCLILFYYTKALNSTATLFLIIWFLSIKLLTIREVVNAELFILAAFNYICILIVVVIMKYF